MTKYLFIDIMTLKKTKVKASKFTNALLKAQKKVGDLENPRVVLVEKNRMIVHYRPYGK